MLFSARAIKLALAAISGTAALSLSAAALAQTACPGPGGANPNGNCANTVDQNYTETPSTTVSGTYTNHISGQVTAAGNGGIALIADEFDNRGTVIATGINSDSNYGYGIHINSGGFTNSGTVTANGIDTGYGNSYGIYIAGGGFTNSGTVTARGIDTGYGSGTSVGYGIYVAGGGIINSGTVTASASGSGVGIGNGVGIYVGGGFTNSGTVTASVSNSYFSNCYGIYVGGGGFTNSGTVTASSYGTGYGYGIYVTSGGFINNSGGTVYASGTGTGTGIHVGSGGFTNSGTVTASSGTVTASSYGYGIHINSGGFTNSGTVTASSYSYGTGIYVAGGGFTNSGTVTASSYSDGIGIYVANDGFINNSGGTVYASGTGTGTGIHVGSGGFTNSGTVTATHYGTGGYGIYIGDGGFSNSGKLTLVSNGGTALYFHNISAGQTFTAESGSSLIISGSSPAIVFNADYGFAGTLSIDPGAELTIMGVNGFGDGSQSFVVAQNVYDTSSFTFDTADSAVFSYSQGGADNGGGSGDYTVSVTREGWASEMTGGEGGKLVEGLENYFISKGTNVEAGSSAENWLYLMNDINSGATRAEVKRRGQDGARLNTAQATGQSLRLVQDASRRAGAIFNKELSKQMRQGTAPAAGGNESSASVWFSPFYLTATQDSSDRSISSVDGDWWGFSLGAGYAPQDNLNFGLGFHFLKGDIDAGWAYDADSTAWGLDLGFAANLGSGRYRPLLTGTVSHTRHDYDQSRRADGYAYKSSPDIKVTTAALNLSQDFHPAGDNFIIRPKIGFDWTRTDMDGYAERGPGLRALKVDSEKYDSYRSELGATLVWKPVEAFELELRAAWLHDFGDRSPILTSVARDVQGLNLYTPRSDDKRDSAAVGASASFKAGKGFSFGLDYDGQFNRDLDSHQIWGSLKYTF